MMNPTTINLVLAGIATVLFSALLAGALAWHGRRKLIERFNALEKDLQVARSGLETIGGNLRRLETNLEQAGSRLGQVRERQSQLELRGTASPQYEQAISMVRQGLTVDHLIECCGLSRGEAELVSQLHRRAARAA